MTDAARNQLQDRLVELRRLLKLFNDDAFALMKAVDYVESVVKEGQPHQFPAALNLIERLLDAEHPRRRWAAQEIRKQRKTARKTIPFLDHSVHHAQTDVSWEDNRFGLAAIAWQRPLLPVIGQLLAPHLQSRQFK